MVVFSTEDQLRLLQEADTIYMDGTFTCCPQLWNQLYSLHARKDDQTYPLVYAFLPDRQTTTYVRLFENLKTHVHRIFNRVLDPVCVQTDFEMAAIRAVEQSFPNADIKGCMFNYTQTIWRKTQQIGLAEQYKNDDSVKTWVRRAAGLPLLPMNEVQNTWLEAMRTTPAVPRAVEFSDYVVTTWVDDDARFPLRMWNHFINAGPRTNNNVEGFHSRVNRLLPHRHPNIYRFVELIKGIEKCERAKLIQINAGAPPPPPRRRVYRELDTRVRRLKQQLTDRTKTPLQYLDAIGHLMKLQ